MKKLYTLLFLLINYTISIAQVPFSGNGHSSFGGAVGQSSMTVSDDGTTITFSFTKGTGDFDDYLVLYFDTGIAGRNTIDNDVQDAVSFYRGSISQSTAWGHASNITFPAFFEASHALSVDKTLGELYSIPTTTVTNGGLILIDNINSTMTAATDASFTFDIDWSELGLTNADSFSFVGYYSQGNAWGSDEAYGDGVTVATDNTDPVTFTSTFEYPSGNTLNNQIITERGIDVFYANNTLKINGYTGKASIIVYDVYGRLLHRFDDLQLYNIFSRDISLPQKQLNIIVIESSSFIKILKVVPY